MLGSPVGSYRVCGGDPVTHGIPGSVFTAFPAPPHGHEQGSAGWP